MQVLHSQGVTSQHHGNMLFSLFLLLELLKFAVTLADVVIALFALLHLSLRLCPAGMINLPDQDFRVDGQTHSRVVQEGEPQPAEPTDRWKESRRADSSEPAESCPESNRRKFHGDKRNTAPVWRDSNVNASCW